MSEYKKRKREFTRDYFNALGEVYAEKGPLAAIAYDISSTLRDIGTRLANIFDSPLAYRESSLVGTRQERINHYRNWERDEARKEEAVEKRNKKTSEYMLRGKKQRSESGLSGRVAVFALAAIGGVALSVSSLNATGNVVSGIVGTPQGLGGMFLLLFGLVGLAFSSR